MLLKIHLLKPVVIAFLLVFVLQFINQGYAQQQPLQTMFWNNYSFYNPAATGINSTYYIASSSRLQWQKINRRPITQMLLFDYKMDKINSGVGINYTFDQLGFENSNTINLNYAYQIKLKKERILSAGLSLGYQKLAIDWSSLSPLMLNDPAIPLNTTYNFFNVGAGFVYQSPYLLVGASATQINENSEPYYKKSRHLYFCSIGTINLPSKFQLKPAVIYRSLYYGSLLEFNTRAVYLKKYWIGSSYRFNDALCFMAGVDIKEKFRISYASDIYSSKLIRFGATHELGLALMLN